MTTEIKKWINENHSDGNINWRVEYERLINTLEQAMTTLELRYANEKLLAIALECGQALLNQEKI